MTASNANITSFWAWFREHGERLRAMRSADDPFWDVALARLKELDPGLWFEMSDIIDDVREFVITAEGDIELFPLVDAIVAAAPDLSGWKWVATKPAMGFDFVTEYDGLRLEPMSMWFLPLELPSDPAALGLRIGIPRLRPSQQREADNGVLVILDTALGERQAAEAIKFVEVASLPADPESEGYIELPELAAYIAWRDQRRRSGGPPGAGG